MTTNVNLWRIIDERTNQTVESGSYDIINETIFVKLLNDNVKVSELQATLDFCKQNHLKVETVTVTVTTDFYF